MSVCGANIWQKAMVFSLQDELWYRPYSNGRSDLFEPNLCNHLFCIDGALNLNGHQPTEVTNGSSKSAMTQKRDILMAAEVPFIV
jgi:hypothetical protein